MGFTYEPSQHIAEINDPYLLSCGRGFLVLELKASGRPAWGFFCGVEPMVFYCPNCWRQIPGEQQVCSHCGENVSSWDERAFTEKLLQALSHPEPLTQIRAVYLLGEKKIAEAAGALTRLFRRSKDPFLQGEVIEAIGKIGGDAAFSLLVEALHHRSFIVRGEAAKALAKFPGNGTVKRALEQALKDPSSYVREIGREAISRLRGSSHLKGD